MSLQTTFLIDTHCHLSSPKMRDHLPELLKSAHEADVQRILNIAYDPETIEIVVEQCRHSNELYAAIGIQPHDADSFSEDAVARVISLAKTDLKVAAIGEIGLDAYHKLSSKEQQETCFERFLEVALEVRLPVVVHVRETHHAVHDRLSSFTKRGGTGVIHCFTGNREEAREFLDLGMMLSFSGIVTFKNAQELQEVAKMVPQDRYLVETDSPYLAPVPHRGKTNQPAWVRETASFIAQLRQVSVETVAQQTTRNAKQLFQRIQ